MRPDASMSGARPVAFELGQHGATPGKRMYGLKVVMDNGLPVTPAASLARNLLRVADFLPFAFSGAIVSMLLRGDYKRLGDIAAGTLVVHETRAVPKLALDTVSPIVPVRALGDYRILRRKGAGERATRPGSSPSR